MKIAFHFLLIFTISPPVLCMSDQTCDKEGKNCKYEESKPKDVHDNMLHKYTKEFNEFSNPMQQIHDAKREFKPCASNCSCHYKQIKKDLKIFKTGITKDMVNLARSKGTLYQIIDGKVYRDEKCSFPARCKGVEHFLLELVEKLPNTEFVLNVRDWPQINQVFSSKDAPLPVFSFSKQEGIQSDILYPAWSFWDGGPAISLHPTGLGRWDIRRKTIIKASNKWKWSKKLDKAFFRGSRTSSDRDALVLLSRDKPDLVDAQYTKNQAWKSEKDTLGLPAADEVSLENHCEYKYLFNFHGVAASFRYKHLFLCGSVVFHEMDGWIEFFYPQMKPWIHYIPFPSRPSKQELEDLLVFAQENDEKVRDIARAGQDFILKRLRMTDVNCYWKKLLKSYTKLLDYEVTLRDELIHINGA